MKDKEIETKLAMKTHFHQWRIFRDPELSNSGYLSFFCQGCLKLKKIKKIYED